MLFSLNVAFAEGVLGASMECDFQARCDLLLNAVAYERSDQLSNVSYRTNGLQVEG